VFLERESVTGGEIVAVGNEIEGESVGIIEKVKLGVKCVSESVGGIVLVSVGCCENVIDKAESVKEFVISAVSDLEAELAESVTSGVSESERERESDTDTDSESVGGSVFDSVGSCVVVRESESDSEMDDDFSDVIDSESVGLFVMVSVFCD
jgi:hydrogenase maturation factor